MPIAKSTTTSLHRRDILRLIGFMLAGGSVSVVASGFSLADRTPVQPNLFQRLAGARQTLSVELPDPTQDFFNVLNRLMFGETATDRTYAATIGMLAWVEEQLQPNVPDDAWLTVRLQDFDTRNLSATELQDGHLDLFSEPEPAPVIKELRQTTLLRQVFSTRQLV